MIKITIKNKILIHSLNTNKLNFFLEVNISSFSTFLSNLKKSLISGENIIINRIKPIIKLIIEMIIGLLFNKQLYPKIR